jgi:phosphoribosylformylglycinamidine cyclo-ligase
LFDIPHVLELIQEASKADDKEILQVFNMGCRMEIYTSPDKANSMIAAATKYGIEAKLIGHVDDSATKSLDIHLNGSVHSFS